MSENKKAVTAEQELLDLEAQIAGSSQAEGAEGQENPQDSQSTQPGDTTPGSESVPDKPNASADEGSNPTDPAKSGDDDSDDDEDISQLSERAQKRFKELAKREKDLREQLLAEKKARLLSQPNVGAPVNQAQKSGNGFDPKGTIPWNQEAEITPEEYEAAVSQKAQTIVQGELKKEKMLATMRADTAEVESMYPELNPDDEANYDDELAVDIATDFKVLHRSNPELRLKDYVINRMKYKDKWSSEAKADVTGKVVKQHANQAMTPTGTKMAQPKSIEDKVKGAKTLKELDELEAELNAQPK